MSALFALIFCLQKKKKIVQTFRPKHVSTTLHGPPTRKIIITMISYVPEPNARHFRHINITIGHQF